MVFKVLFYFILLFTASHAFSQEFNKEEVFGIVKILSSDSLEGRETGSKGNIKSQKIISDYFTRFNLKSFKSDSYLHSFTENKISGTNIIGYIEGTKNKDSYIVVSAHYDHLGVKAGKIYNGADDNASGIGGLMALINFLTKNPPQNSIIFVAFDAEEMDLLGSKAFVNNPPVPLKAVRFNINMDMISRSDKNEIYATGTNYFPYLKTLLEECCKNDSRVSLKFGHDQGDNSHDDWTLASDHASFYHKAIPFIYFGVEDHSDYHRESDDFEKINLEFYTSCIKMIIKSVQTIDGKLKEIEKQKATFKNK